MELREGVDYYLERGLLVMTSLYLLKRGYCCGNGCRHCPYNEKGEPRPEFAQVFEELRSELER